MKIIKILFPVLLLITFSCKKHNTASTIIPITGFPLTNGDSWTYQRFDSINNITDTAVFSITGNYGLNGVIYYTTKTVIKNTVVDSGAILVSADSVIYQPNGQGLFSDITILFPLSAGGIWRTSDFGDSVYVISANINHTVLGTTFDSVYNVGRTRLVPDLYIHQNVFIRPDVGIIEESIETSGWVHTYKTIKLINYTVL